MALFSVGLCPPLSLSLSLTHTHTHTCILINSIQYNSM
uniref:Uncharacterized protein n=1 Tax=Anguilla anguilla TaxID=7936 RepID=A0A0E9QKT2_ANGAN